MTRHVGFTPRHQIIWGGKEIDDAACGCQEKTQGGSDDERKGGKWMKMSEETRCKVRYKRASTDLYRWGEPDRDVYVRKW